MKTTTNDDGYDHAALCQRCQGRGFEPLFPPREGNLIATLTLLLIGTANGVLWSLIAWAFLY